VRIAALLGTLLAGCVETDGPYVGSGQSEQTSCGKGALRRGAVAPEVVDAFYPCCEGKAHFIPKVAVPESFHSFLEQGPGGDTLCVPDSISTDAGYSPRACASVFGLDGACISTCIPLVRQQPIELPRASCAPDERCAPCVHPLTLEETGACGIGERACKPFRPIGKCDELPPTLDLGQFASCCPAAGGKARCAGGDLVKGAMDGFKAEEFLLPCPDGMGGGYCVPEEILARGGRYQPKGCRSVGDREGRCLSICVKAIAEQKDTLPQADCQPHERCAPCFDPRTGIATGACTLGPCDKPKELPREFESCGAKGHEKNALCVPATAVPLSDRCRFDVKGCKATACGEAGSLCVPRAVIDAGVTYEPKKCTASMSGLLALLMTVFTDYTKALSAVQDYSDARCISRCIAQVRDNPSASLLGSAGCEPDEVCVPCYDPTKIAQGKVSTGACERTPCP
jgi:hypothetical protein